MKAQEEGTDRMKEIAEYVREGAMAYLRRQYTVVGKVFIILVVLVDCAGLFWEFRTHLFPLPFLQEDFFQVFAVFSV